MLKVTGNAKNAVTAAAQNQFSTWHDVIGGRSFQNPEAIEQSAFNLVPLPRITLFVSVTSVSDDVL